MAGLKLIEGEREEGGKRREGIEREQQMKQILDNY